MVAQQHELARPASTHVCAGCTCPCHDTPREEHALNAALTYLTPQERRLFDALFDDLGDWVNRRTVARAMWGYGDIAELHSLAVHLARLRAKLAERGAPWRVESLPGSAGGVGSLRLLMHGDGTA